MYGSVFLGAFSTLLTKAFPLWKARFYLTYFLFYWPIIDESLRQTLESHKLGWQYFRSNFYLPVILDKTENGKSFYPVNRV